MIDTWKDQSQAIANLDLESAAVFENSWSLFRREVFVDDLSVQLSLSLIASHIVVDSWQDFQVQAEDVRSVGKSIFASWPGYTRTSSLVHFARQVRVNPPVISSNLQICRTCICLLLKDLIQTHNSAPHQSLLAVPTSVKLMITTLQFFVQRSYFKKCDCMWSPLASQAVWALVFGSAFFWSHPHGGCGWYLEHGVYSAMCHGETWNNVSWRGGSSGVGEVNVPCTCTHGGCEANRCGDEMRWN